MKAEIVHVSPTYFSPESVIGGGERYAEELSRALSRHAPVKFVSFGRRAFRENLSATYERVILRSTTKRLMTPFSPALFGELFGARVIHCHQYFVLPTFLAAATGRLLGSKVFVSDLGGGGWTPAYHVDQSRWIKAHLPISHYAARKLHGGAANSTVIYGGVDLDRYPVRSEWTHDGSVVFLGRLLPHKGIDFLLRAMSSDMPLHVIGPVGDPAYYTQLQQLSHGKRVHFHHGLDDGQIGALLRNAMALVHPTRVDEMGDAGINELFGLAIVEGMASGCAAIVSDATSLPELVEHGRSGLVVRPNDPSSITQALADLQGDSGLWRRLAQGARQRVEEKFTWTKVAERCLEAYRS
jgi:glycosyltransferase involved in cell wall biosynthesis